MNGPLVTCICPTMAARRGWLPRAVRCFLDQTYAERELLFVADGNWIEEFIPAGDNRFRWIESQDLNIGNRRNLACEAARGEIICHWDDDDHYQPGRILAQVDVLLVSQKAVTGYWSAPFFDGEHWYRYIGNPSMVIGTSLCYLKSYWQGNRFASQDVGEDSTFATGALVARQLFTMPDEGMIHCSMHLGNSSPRKIEPSTWRAIPEWSGVEFGQAGRANG